MNLSSSQQYQESLRNAPPSVQEIVSAETTWDAFSEIIQRYGLTQKRDEVGDLVTEVFAAFLPVRLLGYELQNHAGLTQDVAPMLARDIRSALFMPVAKELAQIQQHAERAYTQNQRGSIGVQDTSWQQAPPPTQ